MQPQGGEPADRPDRPPTEAPLGTQARQVSHPGRAGRDRRPPQQGQATPLQFRVSDTLYPFARSDEEAVLGYWLGMERGPPSEWWTGALLRQLGQAEGRAVRTLRHGLLTWGPQVWGTAGGDFWDPLTARWAPGAARLPACMILDTHEQWVFNVMGSPAEGVAVV